MKPGAGIHINLLSERKKQFRDRTVLFSKLQFATGIVLVAYIAILVLVSGARGATALQVNSLEKKIKGEELRITQLKPIETLYHFVANKYQLIDEAYYGRLPLIPILDEVVSLIPKDVSMKSLQLEELGDNWLVTFSSESMYSANSLLDVFENKVTVGEYEIIQISSISRSKDGIYSFNVEFFKGS
jgi:hypothetical protein